jgi:hypothetical protein
MIVTVADHVSHNPAPLKPGDLKIFGAAVTGIRALDAGSDLELFLVIDDTANYDFGAKLEELRRFALAQPASVPMGVAYIHEGAIEVAQNPTTDRALVGKALRAPAGSKVASPYCALSDLMTQWPKRTLRREIVMVSTGIDDSADANAVCVNADMAIRDAERAGVQIFALYNPVADYVSKSSSKVDAGVTGLAHVCYETGGEAYLTGHDPMGSIRSYLDDIAEHLAHQYSVDLKLDRVPTNGFMALFATSESGPELMMPESLWVPDR